MNVVQKHLGILVQKHLGILILLLPYVAAQNSAGPVLVENITAAPRGSELQVKITLSAPVAPSVETAENPHRILLDFPGTTCNSHTKAVTVHINGVRRIRTGQHSATPLITRVVLDLDQPHAYTLKAEGNVVILTVGALEKRLVHGVPVAGTWGNRVGIVRRRHDPVPVTEPVEKAPPASSVALAIVTSALPSALVGQGYQFQVTAQGGKPPYSWSIASGSPAGMSLTSAGLLSGTAKQIGTFNFTVSASDVAGVTISKAFILTVANMCGVNSDGTTLHLPGNYGRLAMPEVGQANSMIEAGQANSMIDDQYGCETWKVADMNVHDAGPANIDSQDRWVITKGAQAGVPPGYFEKNGMFVRDLFTGAIVCTPEMSGAGGWLWGAKAGDQDNIYFHVAETNKIYKLNNPGCIAGGGKAYFTSAWVTQYDDVTGKNGFTGSNLAWCQDASDFSIDGDHLCVGYNEGGNLIDPRLYTVSTMTVGPPIAGSPHQPSGCPPDPTYGNCYRGGFVSPTTNNLVIAYDTANGFTYLDLFNGATGQYILTLNNYNSHGAMATWAGSEYIVDDVNGLDPQRPPNCSPGFQAIKFDGTRTCVLDKYTVGPNGGPEYQEPHLNGIATNGGNAYVAVDVIDYVYNYTAAYTFRTLPNPGSGTVLLTDALTTGDCSAGGGTNKALCRWNGTYMRWDSVSTASFPLQYDWATNWGVYYNEIYFLFLDGSTPRHMVHHRSFSVEPLLGGPGTSAYWSSPRVVASRSGKYMVWDSTWGPNNNISVYVAKIK